MCTLASVLEQDVFAVLCRCSSVRPLWPSWGLWRSSQAFLFSMPGKLELMASAQAVALGQLQTLCEAMKSGFDETTQVTEDRLRAIEDKIDSVIERLDNQDVESIAESASHGGAEIYDISKTVYDRGLMETSLKLSEQIEIKATSVVSEVVLQSSALTEQIDKMASDIMMRFMKQDTNIEEAFAKQHVGYHDFQSMLRRITCHPDECVEKNHPITPSTACPGTPLYQGLGSYEDKALSPPAPDQCARGLFSVGQAEEGGKPAAAQQDQRAGSLTGSRVHPSATAAALLEREHQQMISDLFDEVRTQLPELDGDRLTALTDYAQSFSTMPRQQAIDGMQAIRAALKII